MQKEMIIQKLKECGCRMTKQRIMLLDIIMEENWSCCKEIYYRASKKDPQIGIATIYRMLNTLEEIGAIDRKNMYKITEECGGECGADCHGENACAILLDDGSVCRLSAREFQKVIREGLKAGGYIKEQKMKHMVIQPCVVCRGIEEY